jgi:hypothetical protein
MALKPEISISVGLATAALVYSVYSNATPSITEIRAAKPNDSDVEASRKLAAWTSAGVVAAVSLISKDPTVFILGGGMVVAVDWWHRHANVVNPLVGKASVMMNRDGNLPVATQENDSESFGYADDVSVY